MQTRNIFFDLDDTLYDRRLPFRAAFRQFFGGQYEEKADRAFYTVMHRGYEVFEAAHTGRMSMRQMHIYRHQTGLRDVGICVTEQQALQLQALYAAEQGKITLTDTMQRVLALCREKFAAVGVITNGGVQSQRDKLRALGAAQWLRDDLIFISDAVGVMKPAPEIFRMAQSAAGGGACVYVGDSLTQDIAGAHACGFTTVWMNRAEEPAGGIVPDYTVCSEEALLTCLQTL